VDYRLISPRGPSRVLLGTLEQRRQLLVQPMGIGLRLQAVPLLPAVYQPPQLVISWVREILLTARRIPCNVLRDMSELHFLSPACLMAIGRANLDALLETVAAQLNLDTLFSQVARLSVRRLAQAVPMKDTLGLQLQLLVLRAYFGQFQQAVSR